VKFIDELMAIKTDKLGPDTLLAAAKTSMGSKIVGSEGEFFAKMVVDAIQAVKMTDQVGRTAVAAAELFPWFHRRCCAASKSVAGAAAAAD
jgi:chaperonin GroEL (HSP60 family)